MPVVVAGNYRVRPPKPKQERGGGRNHRLCQKGSPVHFWGGGVGENMMGKGAFFFCLSLLFHLC